MPSNFHHCQVCLGLQPNTNYGYFAISDRIVQHFTYKSGLNPCSAHSFCSKSQSPYCKRVVNTGSHFTIKQTMTSKQRKVFLNTCNLETVYLRCLACKACGLWVRFFCVYKRRCCHGYEGQGATRMSARPEQEARPRHQKMSVSCTPKTEYRKSPNPKLDCKVFASHNLPTVGSSQTGLERKTCLLEAQMRHTPTARILSNLWKEVRGQEPS